MSGHNDDSDDNRKDLTRLEDLSEFLHEENADLDLEFGKFNPKQGDLADHSKLSELVDLDALDDNDEPDQLPDLPPDLGEDQITTLDELEESHLESPDEDEAIDFNVENAEIPAFEFNTENTEQSDHLNLDYTESEVTEEEGLSFSEDQELIGDEIESVDSLDSIAFLDDETPPQINEKINTDDLVTLSDMPLDDDEQSLADASSYDEDIKNFNESPPEKFDDVKDFAQNFSYGTIEGAGNPPYSIVIRNIEYKEDAEDILTLLKEFGIVTEGNLKENEKALSLGSILIPQISEYTAIVLTHKLRRLNLDMEVGLSDEIHPSKSGEFNPRGLTTKSQFKQNKEEEFKPIKTEFKLSDVIATNSPMISGYLVKKYLGVDHAHIFVDEEEIERLKHVKKELHNKTLSKENLSAYQGYDESFEQIHDELLNLLKEKAFKAQANALLGVQFTLSQVADHKKIQYQISCNCTRAYIVKVDDAGI